MWIIYVEHKGLRTRICNLNKTYNEHYILDMNLIIILNILLQIIDTQ